MHPIPDKAEVAIDFPEKFYIGGFGRDSSFDAVAEADDVLIRLSRSGEKRLAEIHLHYELFADILDELALSLRQRPPLDRMHRERLVTAVANLAASINRE